MEAQLQELLPFLRDRNPQARQLALSGLLPQTAKEAPHRKLFFAGLQSGGLQKAKDNDVIRDLKLLCRDQLSVSHDAFRALVNLSDSSMVVNALSEPSFLEFIVSYILNPHSILADLAAMMLSNLTSSSIACSIVLSMTIPVIITKNFPNSAYPTQSRCGSCAAPVPYPAGETKNVPALPLLVDAFVQGASVDHEGDLSKRLRKGDLHFLASVFANITATPTGQKFFLEPKPFNPMKPSESIEYPLTRLVPFTEHKDVIRRGGVASTLKNCSFYVAGHKAILSPDTEKVASGSSIAASGVDALPYILLPLAGPEEFDLDDQEKLPAALQMLPSDKKREQDPAIRLTHIETLLLLCHTRWGRDYQREHGVYEIIRAAHEVETVDKISEHIERLVQLIQGEEPSGAIEEVETNDVTTSVPTPVQAPEEDEDDEESRIEEV
ncbi:hypothetical protein HGRIS_004097 [Hohenbuehelia grisea]|uniref:Protein HGH1 homolog n=1 Tax=Hohenbuehelia grisea TaxID=104357 RepID=A0ABR3JI40_9AGAR